MDLSAATTRELMEELMKREAVTVDTRIDHRRWEQDPTKDGEGPVVQTITTYDFHGQIRDVTYPSEAIR